MLRNAALCLVLVAVGWAKDSKFTRFGAARFQLVCEDFDWEKARLDCINQEGSLATIESEEENDALAVFQVRAWIGLHQPYDYWLWTDGSRNKWSNWKNTEAGSDDKDEPCVFLNLPDMRWYDVKCDKGHHDYINCHICKYFDDTHFSEKINRNGQPTEMRLVRKPNTYDYAERYCIRLGGHLVSIHSKAEHQQVKKLLEGYEYDTWIGYHSLDSSDGRTYSWTDESPDDFSTWGSKEPTINEPIRITS